MVAYPRAGAQPSPGQGQAPALEQAAQWGCCIFAILTILRFLHFLLFLCFFLVFFVSESGAHGPYVYGDGLKS